MPLALSAWPYGQFGLTDEDPRDRSTRSGGMANLREQVNVLHCIARIGEAVLWALLPTSSRRRPVGALAVVASPAVSYAVVEPWRKGADLPLCGEDAPPLRPYMLARTRVRRVVRDLDARAETLRSVKGAV